MRIFIADKSNELRLGLQIFLTQTPGMNVIGMAVKVAGLVDQVRASEAEVLLVNWHLVNSSSPSVLSQLRAIQPRPKVVVMTASQTASALALSAGADAAYWTQEPPNELVNILRTLEVQTTGALQGTFSDISGTENNANE
jgi:DNA-binding NarL/FixJ family response regulator